MLYAMVAGPKKSEIPLAIQQCCIIYYNMEIVSRGKSSLNSTKVKKKPLVQSVERALDILDLLAECGYRMRSSDIAASLGLNPTTTHNLIRTLFKRGYLIQKEDASYFLGPQCYHIGTLADLWDSLRQIALPQMQRLSLETGDNCFLGVYAACDLICVARTKGSGAIIVSDDEKWQDQFHCTAAGKILLAYRQPVLVNRLKHQGRLMKLASNTVTRWNALEKELAVIRRQGYALCRNESAEEVGEIGVPVLDRRGSVLAALSQSFPAYYLETGKIVLDERVRILSHAAREIVLRYDGVPSGTRGGNGGKLA